MDIFSHAIAGAAAGYAVGDPLSGAVAAIIPDLVLPRKRVATPPADYDLTHSLLFVLGLGVAAWVLGFGVAGLLGLISHLVLDVPTHGKIWAPPLFYPFSKKRYSPFGQEWEWFDDTWWFGFAVLLIWCILCLLLSEFPIGSQ